MNHFVSLTRKTPPAGQVITVAEWLPWLEANVERGWFGRPAWKVHPRVRFIGNGHSYVITLCFKREADALRFRQECYSHG